jgi:hypothetical protein
MIMDSRINIRLGWLNGMYLYTIIGADGFGLSANPFAIGFNKS